MIIGNEVNSIEYRVEESDLDLSILEILNTRAGISSRLIRKAKKLKHITLNGNVVSINAKVRMNDVIRLEMEVEPNIFEPEDIPIEVIYEDCDVAVINKQPFVVVHPTKGHPVGTIANGLAKYFIEQGFDQKIRFINRLDRDTTGLMLVAKNPYGQMSISNQMIENRVTKKYCAIVEGHVEADHGTIDLPIGRKEEGDIERVVMAEGQRSITHYKVIGRFNGCSMLEIDLETGRTHQIRVHFSHLGHPLIGDALYGGRMDLMNRQALHCKSMVFFNSRNGERVEVEAALPEDIRQLIETLEK